MQKVDTHTTASSSRAIHVMIDVPPHRSFHALSDAKCGIKSRKIAEHASSSIAGATTKVVRLESRMVPKARS